MSFVSLILTKLLVVLNNFIGMLNIYQLLDGMPRLSQRLKNFRPSWFQSSAATISFASAYSSGDFEVSSTILVLPETYLEANLSNFCGQDLSKFARVIFNQNAYYSFGGFSSTLEEQLATFYDSSNVLQVLSVSEDTHDFLTVNLNLADSKVSRIVNAVENIFPPPQTPRIPSTGCPERIHKKPRPSFSPSNVRVCLILMGGLALLVSESRLSCLTSQQGQRFSFHLVILRELWSSHC